MRIFSIIVAGFLLNACERYRPEQRNLYLIHSRDSQALDTLVSTISRNGFSEVQSGQYDLDRRGGDDLKVYNVAREGFSIFIQQDDNFCDYKNRKLYVFINIADDAARRRGALDDMAKRIAKIGTDLGWQVRAESRC